MTNPAYVFVLQVHSSTTTQLTVFRTLKAVYSYLHQVIPFEITMLSYESLMNDFVDHRVYETNPYKLAWNTDKSWYATVSRYEVLDDFRISVSTLKGIIY